MPEYPDGINKRFFFADINTISRGGNNITKGRLVSFRLGSGINIMFGFMSRDSAAKFGIAMGYMASDGSVPLIEINKTEDLEDCLSECGADIMLIANGYRNKNIPGEPGIDEILEDVRSFSSHKVNWKIITANTKAKKAAPSIMMRINSEFDERAPKTGTVAKDFYQRRVLTGIDYMKDECRDMVQTLLSGDDASSDCANLAVLATATGMSYEMADHRGMYRLKEGISESIYKSEILDALRRATVIYLIESVTENAQNVFLYTSCGLINEPDTDSIESDSGPLPIYGQYIPFMLYSEMARCSLYRPSFRLCVDNHTVMFTAEDLVPEDILYAYRLYNISPDPTKAKAKAEAWHRSITGRIRKKYGRKVSAHADGMYEYAIGLALLGHLIIKPVKEWIDMLVPDIMEPGGLNDLPLSDSEKTRAMHDNRMLHVRFRKWIVECKVQDNNGAAENTEEAPGDKKATQEKDFTEKEPDTCEQPYVPYDSGQSAEEGLREQDLKDRALSSPKDIMNYLNEYVYGQYTAKEKAAMILWRTLAGRKRTSLFIGPTGCGKTEIWRQLAKIYPHIEIVDSSIITQEGWKGDEKYNSCFIRMASKGLSKDEIEHSIVVFDEFDKLCAPQTTSTMENVSLSIQAQFLKMIEGTQIPIPVQKKDTDNRWIVPIRPINDKDSRISGFIDTSSISFVFCGAFSPLYEKYRQKAERNPFGFSDNEKVAEKAVPQEICQEDLIQEGMMPEIVGRIGSIALLDELAEEDYYNILMSGAGISPVSKVSEETGTKVKISEKYARELAREACSKKLGVRHMHTRIQEEVDKIEFNEGRLPDDIFLE